MKQSHCPHNRPSNAVISPYHRLKGDIEDFKDFLRSGPDFEALELARSREMPRETDWADGE